MGGIGLAGAFLGGILTLLSPCSAMLLPAFFSYAFGRTSQLLARTGTFYLGLATTLVPVGMLAGSLGGLITAHRSTVITVASLIVVALGLVQLIGIPVPGLGRLDGVSGASAVSVYLLGTVYGVAGVCAGPILGSVLTVAAVTGSALYGGVVLLVYAAGMVVPLFLLALLWGRVPAVARWLRPRTLTIGRWSNSWTAVIGGLLTVALGILLLLTDGLFSLPATLSADRQVDIESRVLTGTSHVPDLAFAGVAVAVLVAVFVVHRVRARRG